MTTAHRPTWKPAVGRSNNDGGVGARSSTQISALDAPGQLTLKLRAHPVDHKAALKQSLLALEEAEQSVWNKKGKKLPPRPIDPKREERSQQLLLQQTAEVNVVQLKAKYDDSDIDQDKPNASSSSSSSSSSSRSRKDDESDLDKDSDNDKDDNNSSSDDDDDDDEAALQAELAKIRAEREAAKRNEQATAAEQQETEEEAALLGNPLFEVGRLSQPAPRHRRKWNDDVVFRNQAKQEPKPKKRFLNDTVRNDFHKRFLNKFIR